jgi:transcriptional regulator with XRE-family HTH domain
MTSTVTPFEGDFSKRTASPRSPTDVDAHVGQRLRALREAAGLTQADLAAKMGFSFQQLQKYERGINRVACSRLVEFATILKAPLGAFFEGLETAYDGSDTAELVAAFGRISDASRRAEALGAVKALAG